MKKIALAAGILAVAAGFFFIIRTLTSPETVSDKYYPEYISQTVTCDSLLNVDNGTNIDALLAAKGIIENLEEKDSLYQDDNDKYVRGRALRAEFDEKAVKVSRSWVDAALLQLYELEDEEGAVEMYRQALELLDEPNNHDPALDALLNEYSGS